MRSCDVNPVGPAKIGGTVIMIRRRARRGTEPSFIAKTRPRKLVPKADPA
jgi:hypothetical protein